MSKNKYYAVSIGRKVGIFSKWFGKDGAQIQVSGFKNSVYKGFSKFEDAESFLKEYNSKKNTAKYSKIKIYTDGCSLGNPGPGGYGALIIENNKITELSKGFKYTTNNRMELLACISAISKLKKQSKVCLLTDSKYIVNGIVKGWARNWEQNKWIKKDGTKAKNTDLWNQLLQLCKKHKICFKWIKGHSGDQYNDRCDELANIAAKKEPDNIDENYQKN